MSCDVSLSLTESASRLNPVDYELVTFRTPSFLVTSFNRPLHSCVAFCPLPSTSRPAATRDSPINQSPKFDPSIESAPQTSPPRSYSGSDDCGAFYSCFRSSTSRSETVNAMAGQPVTSAYPFTATSSSAALTAGLVSAFGQPYGNARPGKIALTSGPSVGSSRSAHSAHPTHSHNTGAVTAAGCSQPTRITDSDAIQLLAEDVESRLEALLRTFIQEEKLRQQARQHNMTTMGRRSLSLTSLNTPEPVGGSCDQSNHWNTIQLNHYSGSSSSSPAHKTSHSTGNRSSSALTNCPNHSQVPHHAHHSHSSHGSPTANPMGGSCNSLNSVGLSASNSALANFIQQYGQPTSNGSFQAPARLSSHRLGGGGATASNGNGAIGTVSTSNGSARRSASVDRISSSSSGVRSVSPSPPARQHSSNNLYGNKSRSSNGSIAITSGPKTHQTPISTGSGALTKNLFGSPRSALDTSLSSSQLHDSSTRSSLDGPNRTQSKPNRSRSASPQVTPVVSSLSSHLIHQLTGNGISGHNANGQMTVTPAHLSLSNGINYGNSSVAGKTAASLSNGYASPVLSGSYQKMSNGSNGHKELSSPTPRSSGSAVEPLSRRVAAARDQEQKRLRANRSLSLSDANNNLIPSNEKITEARRRSLADGCASYSVVSDTKHKWELLEQQQHHGTIFDPQLDHLLSHDSYDYFDEQVDSLDFDLDDLHSHRHHRYSHDLLRSSVDPLLVYAPLSNNATSISVPTHVAR
jgi:hypothetical protein